MNRLYQTKRVNLSGSKTRGVGSMMARFPTKEATDVTGVTITRVEPSQRGKGRRYTARHKGRVAPKAICDAALAASTARRKRR